MEIGRIAGATHTFGAPPDWDATRDGTCEALLVRREFHDGDLSHFVSAWMPSPDEIARLQAGAPILLSVVGTMHPPVAVMVGTIGDVGA